MESLRVGLFIFGFSIVVAFLKNMLAYGLEFDMYEMGTDTVCVICCVIACSFIGSFMI